MVKTDLRKPWCELLLNSTNLKLNYLSILGATWCASLIPKLNPFWKIVFSYYMQFCQEIKVKTNDEILGTSLWLNITVGTDQIFLVDWFKNGIHMIADQAWGQVHIVKYKYKYNYFVIPQVQLQVQVQLSSHKYKYKYFEKQQVQVQVQLLFDNAINFKYNI